jgi:hypothetical protein
LSRQKEDDSRGSAYVFERQRGSFVEQQKLVASDGSADDTFGSVAISGVTIVVLGKIADAVSEVRHTCSSVKGHLR